MNAATRKKVTSLSTIDMVSENILQEVVSMTNNDFEKNKKKKKRKLCLHYGQITSKIAEGYCYSLLAPINENECQCRQCGKIFPIDKYLQMEELVKYLSDKGCVTDINLLDTALIKKLLDGLAPVHYNRISETETEILDEVKDRFWLTQSIAVSLSNNSKSRRKKERNRKKAK